MLKTNRNVAQIIADNLHVNGIIKEEEKEIYLYGLHNAINTLIGLLTCLLFGFIIGKLLSSLVYAVFFLLLRTNAGGLHFKNKSACFWFSILLDFSLIYTIAKIITNYSLLILMFTTRMIIVIAILSPVDSTSKRLDSVEKKVYGKRARVTLLVLMGVLSVSFFSGMYFVCAALTMCCFGVLLIQILGILSNYSSN